MADLGSAQILRLSSLATLVQTALRMTKLGAEMRRSRAPSNLLWSENLRRSVQPVINPRIAHDRLYVLAGLGERDGLDELGGFAEITR